MVFLAITSKGLNEALRLAIPAKVAVWCGADALSEEEYAARQYPKLSRFSYELADRDDGALADAAQTISEHHPDEVIWIEAAST